MSVSHIFPVRLSRPRQNSTTVDAAATEYGTVRIRFTVASDYYTPGRVSVNFVFTRAMLC